MSTFKETNSLKERLRLYIECKKLYSTKVPVVVEPGKGETRLNRLDSFKYGASVALYTTMVYLADYIRNELNHSGTLFFLVGGENIPVTSSSTIEQLRDQYKDKDDGFLYINYYGVTSDNLI